ncbi:MAG: hypothetical protein COB29_15680, partial [Sulfitobacter sp.]
MDKCNNGKTSQHPKGRNGTSKETIFRRTKSSDGSWVYTEIKPNVRSYMIRIQHDMISLAASGEIDIEDREFVDTATDLSLSNSLDRLVNVRELSMEEAPTIEGVGTGTSLATHVGTLRLTIGGHTADTRCFWSANNRFNIISTDELARAGVGTYVDPTHVDRQLYLVTPDHVNVPWVKVGNIWSLPTTSAASAGHDATVNADIITDDAGTLACNQRPESFHACTT